MNPSTLNVFWQSVVSAAFVTRGCRYRTKKGSALYQERAPQVSVIAPPDLPPDVDLTPART
jgi:hypothetical protein